VPVRHVGNRLVQVLHESLSKEPNTAASEDNPARLLGCCDQTLMEAAGAPVNVVSASQSEGALPRRDSNVIHAYLRDDLLSPFLTRHRGLTASVLRLLLSRGTTTPNGKLAWCGDE
jgi:hypothetical protein